MAYEEALRSITFDADSSIGIYTGVPGMPGSLSPNAGKQFRWVKVTGPRIAGLCSAATREQPIGVLQNKPQNVGDAATVGFSGVSICEAGAGITAGAAVKVDSTGRAITWVSGTDDQDLRKGIAILSAGDAGELISVLILL